MKSRLSFAVLVVLQAVSLTAFAQNNHVDISLRGPWILYVDSSKTFASYPVLIVMGPAVDHDPTNPWAHQPPTVSNGEAYVLADLNQTYPPPDSQIYCLIFDGSCARQGASSLDPDSYPKPNPVKAHVPSGQRRWDWVQASMNNYAPTLILPVPDSYSGGTVWPMRFGPKFDAQGKKYGSLDTYSTGVVLHYSAGPTSFDLVRCPNGKPNPDGTPGPIPSSTNCTGTTSIDHTHLANTGTLQIEITAPDTNWSCDPHVRRVYPKMLQLIGTPGAGPNSDWAVIDPAHDLGAGNQGIYDVFNANYNSPSPDPNNPIQSEFCLEHDNQGGYKDTRWVAPSASNTQKEHKIKPEEHNMAGCKDAPGNIDPWVGCVNLLVKAIPTHSELETLSKSEPKVLSENDGTFLEVLLEVLNEIRIDGSESAFRFPRLAQLRRLDDNIAFLVQLQVGLGPNELHTEKLLTHPKLSTILTPIFELVSTMQQVQDPETKTHGDCGAPTMQVTGN
jgi:hypothetical protein